MRKYQGDRRWRVVYDLAYDGGGAYWSGYYRTRVGAIIARFWNVYFASWGGTAELIDQNRYLDAPDHTYKDQL